jgi:hypothetical protein
MITDTVGFGLRGNVMLRGSVSWISVGLSSADMGAERLIRLARRHKAY